MSSRGEQSWAEPSMEGKGNSDLIWTNCVELAARQQMEEAEGARWKSHPPRVKLRNQRIVESAIPSTQPSHRDSPFSGQSLGLSNPDR